jgi:6,7-dimethyl-8-ribityllumazine synthase
MSRHAPSLAPVPGAPFRVAVAAARYNERLVEALLGQVLSGLKAAGVRDRNLVVVRVPGSNELPVAAHLLAGARPDVVVALGVIIRGGTIHYELIAEATTQALQRVALDSGIPVINGVVVAENARQAAERSSGRINRGAEFAAAALEMAALRRKLAR